jgi:hypothetical protein
MERRLALERRMGAKTPVAAEAAEFLYARLDVCIVATVVDDFIDGIMIGLRLSANPHGGTILGLGAPFET